MSHWKRIIGHVDMDAFYASIEVRDDPSLRGLPIAVGGDPSRRGVVSSASYEARAFGVRSAMPMATAVRLCRDLVVIPGSMEKYVEVSRVLKAVFAEYSPLVEPLSLDEAFLDLTGTRRLFGSPREIGEAIRRSVLGQLELTASVGISTSKFVAKLASDHDKPDGLTIVPPEEVVSFVQALPLRRMWGVGPATLRALEHQGILTMKMLAEASPARLAEALGSHAERLVALARGEDDRPVDPGASAKSISHEVTFARDQGDEGVLEGVLLGLAEKVARRARRQGVGGRTVTLKLRLPDFTTQTRHRTLATPTQEAGTIFRAARALLRSVDRGGADVRLLGVGITGLGESRQLDLFEDASGGVAGRGERRRALQEAEDAIVGRFGRGALSRARTLLTSEAEDTASLPDRPEEDGESAPA
jgi:DNA polymerase-4